MSPKTISETEMIDLQVPTRSIGMVAKGSSDCNAQRRASRRAIFFSEQANIPKIIGVDLAGLSQLLLLGGMIERENSRVAGVLRRNMVGSDLFPLDRMPVSQL